MTQSCNLHSSAQVEVYWLSWYQMTVQVQVHMHQNRIDRYTRSLVISWHPRWLLSDPLQKKIITKSRISQLDTEGRIEYQKCLGTANLHCFSQNAHDLTNDTDMLSWNSEMHEYWKMLMHKDISFLHRSLVSTQICVINPWHERKYH